jgi:tetratricopeptide (TPR) repeat protein
MSASKKSKLDRLWEQSVDFSNPLRIEKMMELTRHLNKKECFEEAVAVGLEVVDLWGDLSASFAADHATALCESLINLDREDEALDIASAALVRLQAENPEDGWIKLLLWYKANLENTLGREINALQCWSEAAESFFAEERFETAGNLYIYSADAANSLMDFDFATQLLAKAIDCRKLDSDFDGLCSALEKMHDVLFSNESFAMAKSYANDAILVAEHLESRAKVQSLKLKVAKCDIQAGDSEKAIENLEFASKMVATKLERQTAKFALQELAVAYQTCGLESEALRVEQTLEALM